jgi:O-antigen/teichoic acid export membrane protein
MKVFARNALARVAAQLAGKLSLFAWTVYLAKHLRPDGFGSYTYILALVTLLSIVADYGLGYLTTNRVARERASAPQYLTHAQILRLFIGTGAYALLLLLSLSSPSLRGGAGAALLLGVTIFTTTGISGICAVLNGREELQWSSLLNALLPTLTLVLGLALLAPGFSLRGAVMPHVIAGVMVVLTGLWILRGKGIVFTPQFDPSAIKDLARAGLPYLLMTLLATLNVSLDTLLLKTMKGAEAVGIYNASYKLVLALMIVPAALGDAAYPIWSRLTTGNARGDQREHLPLRQVVGLLFVLGLAASLILSLAASPLIRLLLGGNYSAAGPVLRVHAWTLLLMFVNAPLAYRLIAAGRLRDINAVFATVVLLNGVLNFILIPRHSFLGAAWTTLISESANTALLIWRIRNAGRTSGA